MKAIEVCHTNNGECHVEKHSVAIVLQFSIFSDWKEHTRDTLDPFPNIVDGNYAYIENGRLASLRDLCTENTLGVERFLLFFSIKGVCVCVCV